VRAASGVLNYLEKDYLQIHTDVRRPQERPKGLLEELFSRASYPAAQQVADSSARAPELVTPAPPPPGQPVKPA